MARFDALPLPPRNGPVLLWDGDRREKRSVKKCGEVWRSVRGGFTPRTVRCCIPAPLQKCDGREGGGVYVRVWPCAAAALGAKLGW